MKINEMFPNGGNARADHRAHIASGVRLNLGLGYRRALFVLLVALGLAAPALLLAPAPAHATPSTLCAAFNNYEQAQIQYGTTSCDAANTHLDNEAAFSSHGDPFTFNSNGNSRVSCEIGVCHGFASAIAGRNLTSYTYISQRFDAEGNVIDTEAFLEANPWGAGASAGASGQWFDSISFSYSDPALNSDPSAPDISFTMTVALSANVGGCLVTSQGDQVEAAGSAVNLSAAVNGNIIGYVQQAKGRGGPDCDDSSHFDLPTETVSVRPGAVIDLHGGMSVGADAELFIDRGPDSAEAFADAAHTGHYYIDVLTPGAFYTDEAFVGAIDPLVSPDVTALPEPSSLALLLAGFGALWFFHARRAGMPLRRAA